MSHRRPRAASGIVAASLCAGPIFVCTMLASQLFDANDKISPIRPELLWIVPVSVFFGFLLSILPNLIGAATLLAMGKGNEAMRLPVMWGLAGGLIAGGGVFAFGGDGPGIAAFAATGTMCALICRTGAIWN